MHGVYIYPKDVIHIDREDIPEVIEGKRMGYFMK
jgi:hypothetical protein